MYAFWVWRPLWRKKGKVGLIIVAGIAYFGLIYFGNEPQWIKDHPLPKKENRIIIESPIIIGQPKKQDQGTVLKQPLPQKESHITRRRVELIKQWRDAINSIPDAEWYAHSADTILFRDKAWYSSLRQYMKKEAIKKLEKEPRTLIAPSDSGGKIPKKVILLDEVARIEKEWGVTGYSDEQPKQPSKEKTQQPVEPKQVQSMDRPYFALFGPEIIKATPELKMQFESDYVIQINAVNIGKHAASNLYTRQIIIDQQFQTKPNVNDGSKGNEVPAGTGSIRHAGITFPPVVLPSYLVFAIKYRDEETPLQKPFYQIWCFKQPGGEDKAPPLHFNDTSIPEREDILSHLKEELRDYFE